jgi:hypothetical protein
LWLGTLDAFLVVAQFAFRRRSAAARWRRAKPDLISRTFWEQQFSDSALVGDTKTER